MRISTRGVYALEALLALASHPVDERLSIREISEQTGLSDSYLEQIFALLKTSGLIASLRGNRGGYCLGRQPETITVGEIIRAAEGSLSPVACTADDEAQCERYRTCLTRPVWITLEKEIDSFFSSFTLADLARSFQQNKPESQPEFFI